MTDSKLLRGTMILTMATFASRILGMVYVFPFVAMVGQQGLALYQYGYQPYVILLSLATLGVPMAVSKFVSKYNAMGDYKTGQRLLKTGILFMSMTGFLAFLALFSMAPVISGWIISDPSDLDGNSLTDVTFVIRMVSVALLIIPVMAVVRGFFQGNQSMGPTAVSQVLEQLVRIVFILSMAYSVLYIMDGDLGTAVGFATFGAFVGGLGGLAVLLFYWKKRKYFIRQQVEESTVDHNLPLTKMYKELIMYALPFSFVGLAIPLFQLVDLFTFNNALTASGYTLGQAETMYGVFSGSAHRLILIPVAIATAMSITLIPAITKSFTSQNDEVLQNQITQAFQVIIFLAVPASAGLMILSYPTFALLFGLDDIEVGGYILRYYAPVAILFSLFSVSAAMLQGINQQRFAVLSLIVGIVIKLILTYPLLLALGSMGAIISTFVGFTAAIIFNLVIIAKYADFNFLPLIKRTILIVAVTLVMSLGVIIVKEGAEQLFPLVSWTNALLVEVFAMITGILLYFVLTVKIGLAGHILGDRFSILKK